MAIRPECPPPESLRGLLLGSLATADQTALTSHLDTCADCRQVLEQMAAGSLPDVAPNLKDLPPGTDEHLQEAIEQIKANAGPTATHVSASSASTLPPSGEPSASHHDLTFLSPSTEPGHLGRLKHYEIISELGRGGMGIVLKAHDETLDRIVAIKVLAPQYAANATARRRFIREALAIAAVTHEHVVTVHAVDKDAPIPFLVMQYIQGVSLQERLDRSGPLEVKEILRIGMQAARGLAAAHAQGLVHRDIKPSNILLENGIERVKITDFGLARAVDDASVTQSGVIAGTPLYMSPEQAGNERIDHRSDLFSLGSVMYAMCTGHPPFRATGTIAVIMRVIEETPRPVREVNPDIPDWLEAIIAKLHAKKPEDRFQSAKELADLLEQHLAHLQQPSQVAMPARVAPPAAKRPRRRFRWAAVLLLAIGLPILLTPAFYLAEREWSHGGTWLGLGVVATGLLVLLISAVHRLRMPKRENDQRWRLAFAPVALLAVLSLPLYVVYRPTIDLYRANAGKLACYDSDPEFDKLLIRGPGIENYKYAEGSTAFGGSPKVSVGLPEREYVGESSLTLWPRSAVTLPPGRYTIEAVGKKQEVAKSWLIQTSALLSDMTMVQDGEQCVVEVKRGQRVRVSVAKWVLPPAPVTGQPSENLSDRDRLQGDWAVAAIDRLGPAIPPNAIKNMHLTFEGRTFRFGENVQNDVGTVMLDVTTSPKQIDLLRNLGRVAADSNLGRIGQFGIFRFEGEDLVLCMGEEQERPKEFKLDPAAPTRMIIRLRRVGAGPDDWTPLFNGKDLSGWKVLPADRKSWRVIDGILVGSGKPSHLFTERGNFGNFHLRMETRIKKSVKAGAAGVFVRIPFEDPKMIISPFGRENLYRFPVPKLYDDQAPPPQPAPPSYRDQPLVVWSVDNKGEKTRIRQVPEDEWFTHEIIVDGTHVTVRSVTSQVSADSFVFAGAGTAYGHVALQLFDDWSIVEFRKIEIKELPSTPKNAMIPASEQGWTPLFNGRDLAGWKGIPDNPGPWSVKDGILRGSGATSLLMSERPYSDFYLRCAARISDGGDSGIFFRGNKTRLQNNAPDGYEAQINATIPNVPRTGSLEDTFHNYQMGKDPLVKPNEWFTYEIIAQGHRIQLKVNGQTTLDWTDPNKQRERGHLALQLTNAKTVVEFKIIEIKELPPSDPAWTPLFNGKDLTGWKTHPELPSDWKIENGMLVGRGKPKSPSYLVSEKGDYQDFHFRIEAKLNETGQAGQLFRSEFAPPFKLERDEYLPWGYEAGIGGRISTRTGFVYRSLPPAFVKTGALVWQEHFQPDGGWFTQEIIADGPRVTVIVNGKTVATIDETKELLKTKYPARDRGHLGLHVSGLHGNSEIQIRKIEIKELPPTPRDDERLQGTWTVVTAEREGSPFTEAQRNQVRLTFVGDTMTWAMPEGKYEGTFKLDPNRYPKEIDFYRKSYPGRPIGVKGIYSLVGDTLMLCLPAPPTDNSGVWTEARPSGLTTRPGDRFIFLHLQRQTKEPPAAKVDR